MTRISILLLSVTFCLCRQEANAQNTSSQEEKLLATKVVGRFDMACAEIPKLDSHWIFTKEGRAIQDGKDMGTWSVGGGKAIITFTNKKFGLAILSFKDENTLVGKNEHKNGSVFNWVLKREGVEGAQKPKEDSTKPKGEPAKVKDETAPSDWNHVKISGKAKVMEGFLRIEPSPGGVIVMPNGFTVAPDMTLATKETYSGPVEITVVVRMTKKDDPIRLNAFGQEIIFNAPPVQGMPSHNPGDRISYLAFQFAPDTWHTVCWRIKRRSEEVLVNDKVIHSSKQRNDLSSKKSIGVSNYSASGLTRKTAGLDMKTLVVKQIQETAEEKAAEKAKNNLVDLGFDLSDQDKDKKNEAIAALNSLVGKIIHFEAGVASASEKDVCLAGWQLKFTVESNHRVMVKRINGREKPMLQRSSYETILKTKNVDVRLKIGTDITKEEAAKLKRGDMVKVKAQLEDVEVSDKTGVITITVQAKKLVQSKP